MSEYYNKVDVSHSGYESHNSQRENISQNHSTMKKNDNEESVINDNILIDDEKNKQGGEQVEDLENEIAGNH